MQQNPEGISSLPNAFWQEEMGKQDTAGKSVKNNTSNDTMGGFELMDTKFR
jgi:hypothetical protein